jgi:hypothetical protein
LSGKHKNKTGAVILLSGDLRLRFFRKGGLPLHLRNIFFAIGTKPPDGRRVRGRIRDFTAIRTNLVRHRPLPHLQKLVQKIFAE